MRQFALISLFALLAVPALAAPPDSQNITNRLSYIEMPPENSAITDILQKPVSAWRHTTAGSFGFGFSKNIYWFRFDRDRLPDLSEAFAVFEWKPLGKIDFYAIKDGEIKGHQQAGETIPYPQWSVTGTYYPTFTLGAATDADFYLARLESASFKSFPVKLQSRSGVLKSIRFETGIVWFYGGLVFVLIFFSALMFVFNRDRIYVYYVGYILSVTMAFSFTYGNGYAALWGESPWWQNHGVMLFLALQIFFSAQFVRRLLDLKNLMPKTSKVITFFAWLALLTSPLTLTDQPRQIFSRFYSSLYLVLIPAFYMIGIYLRGSAAHIRTFLIGWSILFLFGMLQILFYLGILPFGYITVYGAVFIFPIDLMFFSLSIWRRYAELRSEKEKALAEKREILERLQGLTDRPRYAKFHIQGLDIEQILIQLDFAFQNEKLYTRENLRLDDLATRLSITGHQLSEILNTKFGKNFSAFVNLYRIAEAKKLLLERVDMTALAVAFETGFGSKTRFNVEFKKATGVTPQEFRSHG